MLIAKPKMNITFKIRGIWLVLILPNVFCNAKSTSTTTPSALKVTVQDINECATEKHDCHRDAMCDDTLGSFTCTCTGGFTGNGVTCSDIDECETNTHSCDKTQATCTNADGSFTCACKSGFAGNGKKCTDADECDTNKNNCHSDANCSNTPGSFTCECKNGYSGNGVSCLDIDECAIKEYNNCNTNAECTNAEGSFTCNCSSGFSGNGVTCSDKNECDTNRGGCDPNALCTNTPGSFTCICISGYTGNGVTCSDIDECTKNTHNCSTNAICGNTPGAFTCRCKSGYTGNGVTCSDKNECDTNRGGCHINAVCKNTPGSFTCKCNRGYIGNGVTCSDIDECIPKKKNKNCHRNAKCNNTPGSFACTCKRGYTGDGKTCSDINECETEVDNCHKDAECTNTNSSFTCLCMSGYTGNGTTCLDIDECETNTDNCNDTLATCTNIQGSFTCACNSGYEGDGRVCSDIDECSTSKDKCSINAVCANTAGSFTCKCKSGYTGDGLTCSDINECSRNTDNCHNSLATCTDTQGSFTCTCKRGYVGDGRTCSDMDECATNRDDCNTNARCTNNVGSFTCRCNTGYTGNGVGTSGCQDINECSRNTHNCHNTLATCKNTQGSFTCTCKRGYVGDGRTCSDMDECATNRDDCNTNARCTNNVGSFTCRCNTGYTGNGRTCTDIDECATNRDNCNTNARCTDTAGSFTCRCNSGYTGNGETCLDIDECATNTNNCNRNAGCTNTFGSFTCTCNNGFTGNGETCTDFYTQNSAGTCTYYFSSFTVGSYTDAQTQCSRRRSVLAKFKTSSEMAFARSTIGTVYPSTRNVYYVGGRREENNIWLWNDKDNITPSPSGSSSCAAISTFSFTSVSCLSTRYFSCERRVRGDNCQPNPCQNGGTCTPDGCTFTCRCALNYFGYTCDTQQLQILSKTDITAIKDNNVNLEFNVNAFVAGSVACTLRSSGQDLRTFGSFQRNQRLSYMVNNIQRDKRFVLTCVLTTSSNVNVQQTRTVNVVVHVPASIQVSESQVDIVRSSNPRTVIVDCTSTGTPLPTVVWRKNNEDVATSSSSSVYRTIQTGGNAGSRLILTNARFEDQGMYGCVAYNLVGPLQERRTVFQNTTVTVTGIPETVSSTEYLVLPSTNNVSFECLFDGNPLPTLQWTYSNGDPLPQTSQFEISPFTQVTAYRVSLNLVVYGISCRDVSLLSYRCEASNSLSATPVSSQPFVVNINRTFWRYSDVSRTCLEAKSYCAGKGGSLIVFPNQDVMSEINRKSVVTISYWISSQTLEYFENWSQLDTNRMPNTDGCIRVSKSNGVWSISQTLPAATLCDVRVLLQPSIRVNTDVCDGESASISWNNLPGTSSLGSQLVYFTSQNARKNVTIPRGDLASDIVNLMPRTLYKTQVIPLYVGCNTIVPTRQSTLFNTTRGGLSAPNHVRVGKNNGMCSVSWEDSNIQTEIGAFRIKYTAIARQSQNEFEPEVNFTRVGSTISQFDISSLKPNSEYEIMVGAVASSPCEDRISVAWSNETSGCVTPPSAPEMIPLTPAVDTNNQIEISLTPASERNGLISCYFVVVQRVVNDSDIDVENDINLIQQTDDGFGKYIAFATNLTEPMSLMLGDRKSTCCDVSGNQIETCPVSNVTISRKRRAAILIIQGQNRALEPNAEYQYYVLTATPDPDGPNVIYLASSASPRFRQRPAVVSSNTGLIVGIVIVIIIILIILAVVIYKRRQLRSWVEKRRGIASNFRPPRPAQRNSPNESIEQQIDLVPVNVPDPFVDFYISTNDLLNVYYRKIENDTELFDEEFQENLIDILSNSTRPTIQANLPQNKSKNRYKNIKPVDSARVILQKTANDPHSDYINASLIDGYSVRNKFIAAQGPKSNTVNDFWRMIDENGCKIIVMLTLTEENRKVKCEQYWPDLGEEKTFGRIKVRNFEEIGIGEYLRRSLSMTKGNVTTEIHQYQYLTWPDHGVPSTTSALLQLYYAVISSGLNDCSPILVHCSAGVGRTGTFIALDILSEQMSQDGEINVLKCVHDLRLNRTEMVQGVKQYVLIHKLMAEVLVLGNTEVDVDQFLRYNESLKIVNRHTRMTELQKQFNDLTLVGPTFTSQEVAYKPVNQQTYHDAATLPYDNNLAFVSMTNLDQDVPFLNASVIQSYNAGYFYITAQDPLPSNIHLFWRCIADNEIKCIVMLAEDEASCPKYWADDKEANTFDDVTVRCTDFYRYPGYMERTLDIFFETAKTTHSVKQIVLTGWVDANSPPNKSTMVEILSKVEKYLADAVEVRGKKFVALFHCHDGSDRSGTVCAIANVLDRLKNENKVNVFRAVKDLRDLRAGMVSSLEHYQFCYEAVCEYIQTFDLYGNFK